MVDGWTTQHNTTQHKTTLQKITKNTQISFCKDTKQGKSPREDAVLEDILMDAVKEAYSTLSYLFSKSSLKENIAESWYFTAVILLQKKYVIKKNLISLNSLSDR